MAPCETLMALSQSHASYLHAQTLFAGRGFVSHWTVPLVQWLRPLLHAYDVALCNTVLVAGPTYFVLLFGHFFLR
jgi:hypothetical protein